MEKQPNHENNLTAIRQQLLRGWRISVQSVLSSVGTQELRHYISILRKDDDVKIETEWVTKNGKRLKEYFTRREQKVA